MTNLGAVVGALGLFEQIKRYTGQALAVAERIGNPSLLCFNLCQVCQDLMRLGEWREARQVVGRAVDVARTTGSGLHVCNVHAAIGALALREGDWTEAARSLEESLRVAEQTGFHQSQDLAQLYLAELDIREERPEQAIKRLEPLVAEENAFPDLLPPLARAYLCIDDEKHIQQAAEIAERAVSQGRKQPGSLVDALLVRGMVLIRQRRDQEADRVLTEGLALARSQSFPYGEARILVQMGVLHLQRGEPEQAQARLEETLVIFQRLGARKDVEQVEEMIGRS